MNAEQLLTVLRKRDYIREIAAHGNKKVWFSTDIPQNLPVGSNVKSLVEKEMNVPFGNYIQTKGKASGWMSYWRHTGPKCSSATAFVSILPAQEQRPILKISRCEPMHKWINQSGERIQFGLHGEWLSAFNAGVENGLKSVLSNPLANIEVRILNAIVDMQDSDLKAFELLGKWLIEQLTIELYRRGLIERA